jgi:hypothetical protein
MKLNPKKKTNPKTGRWSRRKKEKTKWITAQQGKEVQRFRFLLTLKDIPRKNKNENVGRISKDRLMKKNKSNNIKFVIILKPNLEYQNFFYLILLFDILARPN